MNIFSLSNTKIQTRHLQNITCMLLDTPLVPCKTSWIYYIVNKGKLENFYIYSETNTNNQVDEESTAGSNKVCDAIKQHKNDRCRP
jgi:hypothetical protein